MACSGAAQNVVIERQQIVYQRVLQGPDDRTVVPVKVSRQGQKCQRAAGQESLPAGVRCGRSTCTVVTMARWP